MTVQSLALDHLVVAARTLEEGVQFLTEKFGAAFASTDALAQGGAHPSMRTHNRLLNLWGGAYLEVIAVDPAAPSAATPRPRLFALDDPAFQQRLEAGPQLVHWVARVDRPKLLARWQAQFPERIAPVVAMSRGTTTWSLTVPDDGAFPAWLGAGDGIAPSLIQWDTALHPSAVLPEAEVALKSLKGFHPQPDLIREQLEWLGAAHLIALDTSLDSARLVAEFETPAGLRSLR